jgi:hypothetical protein
MEGAIQDDTMDRGTGVCAQHNVTQSRTKPHAQRKIWLMTYSPPEQYVTAEMLKDLGSIDADECHSTSDRVMVYTYIHTMKRLRQSSFERFMEKAKSKYGITKNEIFGYEAIAYNIGRGETPEIENHVAFKMLVNHVTEGNTAFKPYTDGENILKRGMLMKAIGMEHSKVALEYQTKEQLIKYIKKLEKSSEEAEEMKMEFEALKQFHVSVVEERSRIRLESAEQKRLIQALQAQMPQAAVRPW